MMTAAKNWLRKKLRERRWRKAYPLLLPHAHLSGNVIEGIGLPSRAIRPETAEALTRCNGRQTLATITRNENSLVRDLLALHDEGVLILWPRPVVATFSPQPAETVIFSPHPDDAALSLGAMLSRDQWLLQEKVLIVNVFSRTAWWRFDPAASEIVHSTRLAEETMVASLVNAELKFFDLPEALLRGHRLEEVFTAQPGPAEEQVVNAIRQKVTDMVAGLKLVRRWYLPLGIGNHLDHRLTRDGVYEALRAANIDDEDIAFYEELPYALSRDGASGKPSWLDGWKRSTTRSGVGSWRWKRELLRVYWSQLTWSQIREVVEWTRRNGERIWSKQ